MEKVAQIFQRADFSAESEFQDLLREKLFGQKIRQLSLDELFMVSAAGDIYAKSMQHSNKTDNDSKQ